MKVLTTDVSSNAAIISLLLLCTCKYQISRDESRNKSSISIQAVIFQTQTLGTLRYICKIWGFYGSDKTDYCLLGYTAVQLKGQLLKLPGNLSPPSSYPQCGIHIILNGLLQYTWIKVGICTSSGIKPLIMLQRRSGLG